MLKPRIIPCLLIHNGGLVKTIQFGNPKYVGDPLNAVRIFNEKEVDELMVLDIDRTVQNKEPDYNLILSLAAECRMPLCYGGGVKKVEQVEDIISLGVEKVAISSAAIDNPELVSEASARVGSQSVVVVMDVKRNARHQNYEIFTHNGSRTTSFEPVGLSRRMESLGAGELVINSIDLDGTMTGYDFDLLEMVRNAVSLPLTIMGGAGKLRDLSALIEKYPIIGAAAGSLFVFKGKYRAVLISYPNRVAKEALFS